MVSGEFANFFVASTSSGAALVGLLFVAVSIAPEQTVQTNAPLERRAVASGAFFSPAQRVFYFTGSTHPSRKSELDGIDMGKSVYRTSLGIICQGCSPGNRAYRCGNVLEFGGTR